MTVAARVATRWIGGPPVWPGSDSATATPSLGALSRLLMDSLRRGHRKVAVRRFLMLRACRSAVAADARAACEATISTLPVAELRRMTDAAQAWAVLVCRA